MSEASRMYASSSAVLISMPPPMASAQSRENALFHVVHATHSVDRAHDAARLVVTGEQRGLGLVFDHAPADRFGLVVGADDELLAVLVAASGDLWRRVFSVGRLALRAGLAAGEPL